MTLVAAALLTVGVVVFTLLVRSSDLPEPAAASPLRHLEEKKDRVQEGLRDLDFEHGVGKLSEADYRLTKLDLEKDLALVMAQIDKLAGETPRHAPAATETAGTCPHCGAEFERELKFCGECGKPMKGETA